MGRKKVEQALPIPILDDPYEYIVSHTDILNFFNEKQIREQLETLVPTDYYGEGILIGYEKAQRPRPTSSDHKLHQSFEHKVFVRKLQLLVNITYKDTKGKVTNRNVTIDSLEQSEDGQLYFQGFCHLTKQTRTFRLDRVEKVAIPDTGEVISTDELLSRINKQSSGTA
jgi:hypothetical protein